MNLEDIRKNSIETYFKKVDNGIFDEEFFTMYTEDVEVYYPKFGFEKGKKGIANLGRVMGGHLKSIKHDIKNFRYIIADSIIAVEGTEEGVTQSGRQWPDHKVSHGKFCSVFEFEGELIKRMHVYVDPDFASEDADRIHIFNTIFQPAPHIQTPSTRDIIDAFYEVLFKRKEGNILDFFAEQVDWDLPGNKEKFPWTGKRETKKEIEEFFTELFTHVQSKKFDIDFISINGENATVTGSLSSTILKYNRVFETEFVAIFKIINGKIVKYHFLEDSYKLNEEMK